MNSVRLLDDWLGAHITRNVSDLYRLAQRLCYMGLNYDVWATRVLLGRYLTLGRLDYCRWLVLSLDDNPLLVTCWRWLLVNYLTVLGWWMVLGNVDVEVWS